MLFGVHELNLEAFPSCHSERSASGVRNLRSAIGGWSMPRRQGVCARILDSSSLREVASIVV